MRKVQGLASLFFVSHFAASVYVVFASIGAMALVETSQPAPNRLVDLAAKVLTFPTLPIALALPESVIRFVPLLTLLLVNSLLWLAIALFLTKRIRHLRAAV